MSHDCKHQSASSAHRRHVGCNARRALWSCCARAVTPLKQYGKSNVDVATPASSERISSKRRLCCGHPYTKSSLELPGSAASTWTAIFAEEVDRRNSLGCERITQWMLTSGLMAGLTSGMMAGLAVGLMAGLTSGLGAGLTVGLTVRKIVGVTLGSEPKAEPRLGSGVACREGRGRRLNPRSRIEPSDAAAAASMRCPTSVQMHLGPGTQQYRHQPDRVASRQESRTLVPADSSSWSSPTSALRGASSTPPVPPHAPPLAGSHSSNTTSIESR